MFSIDGSAYEFPCDITRKVVLVSTRASGELMNGHYFNDVSGAYLQYDVKLVVPKGMENTYNNLFEKLTEVVGEHEFIFPYNNSYVQFNGRIEAVSDQLYFGRWRGTTFSAVANDPYKEPSV